MEQQNGDGNGIETRILDTIRKRLSYKGDLNKIKSELRAMVINDVRAGDKLPINSLAKDDDAKSPSQIANHLILEYFEWFGFEYSLNMFTTESGCAGVRAREHVESKVGIKDGQFDKELPLLVTLVMNMMKKNNAEK